MRVGVVHKRQRRPEDAASLTDSGDEDKLHRQPQLALRLMQGAAAAALVIAVLYLVRTASSGTAIGSSSLTDEERGVATMLLSRRPNGSGNAP